ncbi:hypothetical protein CHU98_g2695 [Xylaria longipes]|nr:hypothetical protein CHU98_g2695 [Xylaria longipes]
MSSVPPPNPNPNPPPPPPPYLPQPPPLIRREQIESQTTEGCVTICVHGLVEGKAKFGNQTTHVDPPACKCRRNMDQAQEKANDRYLLELLADGFDHGRTDSTLNLALAFIFLKQNAPGMVPQGLTVEWNENEKTWGQFKD